MTKLEMMSDEEICMIAKDAMSASHGCQLCNVGTTAKNKKHIAKVFKRNGLSFKVIDLEKQRQLIAEAEGMKLSADDIRHDVMSALCTKFRMAGLVRKAYGIKSGGSKTDKKFSAVMSYVVKRDNIYMLRGSQVMRTDDQCEAELRRTGWIDKALDRLAYINPSKNDRARLAKLAFDRNITNVLKNEGITVDPGKIKKKENHAGRAISYKTATQKEIKTVIRMHNEKKTELQIAHAINSTVNSVYKIKKGLREMKEIDFVHASRSNVVNKPKNLRSL